MTARGYKSLAWFFVALACFARAFEADRTAILAVVCLSFICFAASDILKAVSK